MNLRILIGLFLIVVFVFFHIFHMYKWNIIFEDQSDYQTIELVERNSEFALLLNGNIQVHSNEYEISHRLQCNVPIEKFKPKNILILGGGDLIAARFCLEDKNVEKVTNLQKPKVFICFLRFGWYQNRRKIEEESKKKQNRMPV